MSASALSYAFEGIVSVLLVVMIVYASRLNSRLADLRARESELQEGIARFNEAAARAEAAATRLKSVGSEAERAVRSAYDRATALRDELLFLIDRGEAPIRRPERAQRAAETRNEPVGRDRVRRELRVEGADEAGIERGRKPVAPARAERAPARQDQDMEAPLSPRSAAERELLKAIRAAHGAR